MTHEVIGMFHSLCKLSPFGLPNQLPYCPARTRGPAPNIKAKGLPGLFDDLPELVSGPSLPSVEKPKAGCFGRDASSGGFLGGWKVLVEICCDMAYELETCLYWKQSVDKTDTVKVHIL